MHEVNLEKSSQSEINDGAVNQTLDKIKKINNQEEVNDTLFELGLLSSGSC